jgi:hypothetical protein
MKHTLNFLIAFCFAFQANADDAASSFEEVMSFSCVGQPNGSYWLQGDTTENTISGSVFSNEFPWTFNNTILRDNDLPEGDLVVGVTRDFLGSGADIFGGVVASTDEQGSSFGALF